MNNIPASLEKYIATRDRKQNNPISKTPLREQFLELLERGKVEVGGRSSCGSRVDPTWVFFTAWNEVVKKANLIGYSISVAPVKHANKSPTMAGGFWYSNLYEVLESVARETP
jgi:hypothetical protein